MGYGCPESWDGGDVVVEAGGEALNLSTALFSYISCGDSSSDQPHPAWLIVYLFDESVDFETAKAGGGTRLELSTYWYYYDNDNTGWFTKDSPKYARLYSGGDMLLPDVLLDVHSWSGSWEVFDPQAPPVLHGTIESSDPLGPHGTFDAAYCGDLVVWWCPG